MSEPGTCMLDRIEYPTNPCLEIVLSNRPCPTDYRQVWMDNNMGGVDYKEALELLKLHYPEKFI